MKAVVVLAGAAALASVAAKAVGPELQRYLKIRQM
jgi:hypothetical protein